MKPTRFIEYEVIAFLKESLAIERINRPVTEKEIEVTSAFLCFETIDYDAICSLQAVYAPGYPVRDKAGMNVHIGGRIPMAGGPKVVTQLTRLVDSIIAGRLDPLEAHTAFEILHPFMDGNGCTGRTLWAWHKLRLGLYPFNFSFLQQWYYDTLAHYDQDY